MVIALGIIRVFLKSKNMSWLRLIASDLDSRKSIQNTQKAKMVMGLYLDCYSLKTSIPSLQCTVFLLQKLSSSIEEET